MIRSFFACVMLSLLIGWSYPSIASGISAERESLAGITSAQITVGSIPAWAEEHGATRDILRTMANTALTSGGVKLSDTIDDTGGILDLTVEGFSATNPNIFFYITRLSLGQRVRLPDGRTTYARTWQDDGFGATEKAEKTTFLLIGSVTNSLNKFISDYKSSRGPLKP